MTKPFAVTLHGATNPGLQRVGDYVPDTSYPIASASEAVRLVDAKGFAFDDEADEKRARNLARREAEFRAMDLAALRAGKVGEIVETLPRLSPEQITELHALETAEESPRATLIRALDDNIATHEAEAAAGGEGAANTTTNAGGATP